MVSSSPSLRVHSEILYLGCGMRSKSIPFLDTTSLLYSVKDYKQSSIIVTQYPIIKMYILLIKIFKTFCVCFQAETHYVDQDVLELASCLSF